MKNIQTEIIINMPVASVWNTLMDFKVYPNWNPFIHIKGIAKVGEQLENTIFLEGQKPQTFKPTVLEIEHQKRFRWVGYLLIKGIFDGEHSFQLESLGQNQTRLIHSENFQGILSILVFKMIGKSTKEGFEKMNEALKKQCEKTLVY